MLRYARDLRDKSGVLAQHSVCVMAVRFCGIAVITTDTAKMTLYYWSEPTAGQPLRELLLLRWRPATMRIRWGALAVLRGYSHAHC
jgi:hypothetical protein